MRKGLLIILAALVLGSCATTVNRDTLPAVSIEATPFEGTWTGTAEHKYVGDVTIQFTGNIYILRQYSNQFEIDTWGRGVFTYTNDKITLYNIENFIPFGYTLKPGLFRKEPLVWSALNELGANKTIKSSIKYTMTADSLAIGFNSLSLKYRLNKTETPIKMPEDFVFFVQGNNFMISDKYNLTITAINDVPRADPPYIKGMGGMPAEQREPGTYKIDYRQTLKVTVLGGDAEIEHSGSFTKHFEPGIYRFFVYSRGQDYHNSDKLPPLPDIPARVVIEKKTLSDSDFVIDSYIDSRE